MQTEVDEEATVVEFDTSNIKINDEQKTRLLHVQKMCNSEREHRIVNNSTEDPRQYFFNIVDDKYR